MEKELQKLFTKQELSKNSNKPVGVGMTAGNLCPLWAEDIESRVHAGWDFYLATEEQIVCKKKKFYLHKKTN